MSTASRKTRAVAAGGAVIGLGVAMTLAAWSDSEFARGTFSTANFGIQGAAGDNNFADHPTEAEALNLVFSPAQPMQPGQTVFQPYQLKNIQNGVDSTVTLASETKSGNLPLTAQVIKTTGTTCDANTTGEQVNVGGSFDLTGQTVQNFCIKVTLDQAYEGQGESNDIVWRFDAAPQGQ